jgi:hypothetical protein
MKLFWTFENVKNEMINETDSATAKATIFSKIALISV